MCFLLVFTCVRRSELGSLLQSLPSSFEKEQAPHVCCVLLFIFVPGRTVQWPSQNVKAGYLTNSGDCRVIDLHGNDDLLYRGPFFDLLRCLS